MARIAFPLIVITTHILRFIPLDLLNTIYATPYRAHIVFTTPRHDGEVVELTGGSLMHAKELIRDLRVHLQNTRTSRPAHLTSRVPPAASKRVPFCTSLYARRAKINGVLLCADDALLHLSNASPEKS